MRAGMFLRWATITYLLAGIVVSAASVDEKGVGLFRRLDDSGYLISEDTSTAAHSIDRDARGKQTKSHVRKESETVSDCVAGLLRHKDTLREAKFPIPQNGENVDYVEGGSTDSQFEYLGKIAAEELVRKGALPGGKRGVICETGFNYGTSAYAFLCATTAAKVLSFDLGDHHYVKVASNLLQDEFPGRHALTIGDSNITLRGTIAGQGPLAHDERCDIIFVDGGHYHDQALNDIELLSMMAAPDALVLVDDCTHDGGNMAGAAFVESVNAGVISETLALARHFGPERDLCAGRYATTRRSFFGKASTVLRTAFSHASAVLWPW